MSGYFGHSGYNGAYSIGTAAPSQYAGAMGLGGTGIIVTPGIILIGVSGLLYGAGPGFGTLDPIRIVGFDTDMEAFVADSSDDTVSIALVGGVYQPGVATITVAMDDNGTVNLAWNGTSYSQIDAEFTQYFIDQVTNWVDGTYTYVIEAPTLTAQPQSQSIWLITGEDTATFTCTATDGSPSGVTGYQWTEDGVDMAGETATTLTFTAVLADNGKVYRCIVSNDATSTTSVAATLSVADDAFLAVYDETSHRVDGSGNVTWWDNVIGNTDYDLYANAPTAFTEGLQNGLATVNSAGSFMFPAAVQQITGDYTIIVVGRQDAPLTGQLGVALDARSGNSNRAVMYSLNDDGEFMVSNFAAGSGDRAKFPYTTAAGQPWMGTLRRSGDNLKSWFNAETPIDAVAPGSNFNALRLFSVSDDQATRRYLGELFEVRLYSEALSDAQVATVTAILTAKWIP